MPASGLSILLCWDLVRAYIESAAPQRYVETKGSSCTACFVISGHLLLSRDQNSKIVCRFGFVV